MRLSITKLTFLTILVVSIFGINTTDTEANWVECDGGRYRLSSEGDDPFVWCGGYNWPCTCCGVEHWGTPPWYYPARCGACYQCVNGSYVSGGQACDLWNTPTCRSGQNYSYCWAGIPNFNTNPPDALWMDQLNVPNNKLCCTPGATTCTAIGSCSKTCGGGTQPTSCTNGCQTWTASQSCNTQACNTPPTISYLNAWGYGPKGASGKQLTKADNVCPGDTVRFYFKFSDDKTANSAIRYRYGGNPAVWTSSNYSVTGWDLLNGAASTYSSANDYWYYDWTIPPTTPSSNGVSYYTWEDMDQDGLSSSSWGTTDGSNTNPGFKIDRVLTAPATITPTTGSTIDSHLVNTITWSAVPNAANYFIGIDDLTDGWKGALDKGDFTTSTSYTFNFVSGHNYHIWVNGLTSCGTSGPQVNTTIQVKPYAPDPTVSPALSIKSGCNTGHIMFISWTNTEVPVTWADISENDPSFNTYYHKSIPSELQKANEPGGTYAPEGFYGCGTMCGNKVPGDQELKICEGKTYYVRLFNGTDYSYSSVTINPIPTNTPQPWTKTHGGDVHVNQ